MLVVRCFRQLFANGNGIAGLQRHDVAAEQIARIDADFLALTGDGDGLGIAVTGVIGRRDGLRQGQSLDPRDVGMLHRTGDNDDLSLPCHAGERGLLAGQISLPGPSIGLRPGDAAAEQRCDQQRQGSADAKRLSGTAHIIPVF